ncbi:MAG: hypothetical protein ACOCQD_00675 [archaeon]
MENENSGMSPFNGGLIGGGLGVFAAAIGLILIEGIGEYVSRKRTSESAEQSQQSEGG